MPQVVVTNAYQLEVSEVVAALQSDVALGLSEREARERLGQCGRTLAPDEESTEPGARFRSIGESASWGAAHSRPRSSRERDARSA